MPPIAMDWCPSTTVGRSTFGRGAAGLAERYLLGRAGFDLTRVDDEHLCGAVQMCPVVRCFVLTVAVDRCP